MTDAMSGDAVERARRVALRQAMFIAFTAWFETGGVDFWSERNAPEHLSDVAANIATAAAAAARKPIYEERDRCVALIARMALALGYNVGLARTDIPGWEPEWHWCVYIDLPKGQVSWHFHETEINLFADLPRYKGEYDGHDSFEKYQRVALTALPNAAADARRAGWDDATEALSRVARSEGTTAGGAAAFHVAANWLHNNRPAAPPPTSETQQE